MPVWNRPPSVHSCEPRWGSGPTAGKLSLHSQQLCECSEARMGAPRLLVQGEEISIWSLPRLFPSPYLRFSLEKQPQSTKPSILLSEQRIKASDRPLCGHPTTDFWRPARSLEFLLKFWAVMKSPLPDPDGFDFNFLTTRSVSNKGLREEDRNWREEAVLIHWLKAIQPWVNTDLDPFSDHYLNGLSVIIHYDYLMDTACVN